MRTLRSETISDSSSPLKVMKNAFYFIEYTLFVLKLFKFLFCRFRQVGKRLDKKSKVNIKIYDVTSCETNNDNTHIAHYVKK